MARAGYYIGNTRFEQRGDEMLVVEEGGEPVRIPMEGLTMLAQHLLLVGRQYEQELRQRQAQQQNGTQG